MLPSPCQPLPGPRAEAPPAAPGTRPSLPAASLRLGWSGQTRSLASALWVGCAALAEGGGRERGARASSSAARGRSVSAALSRLLCLGRSVSAASPTGLSSCARLLSAEPSSLRPLLPAPGARMGLLRGTQRFPGNLSPWGWGWDCPCLWFRAFGRAARRGQGWGRGRTPAPQVTPSSGVFLPPSGLCWEVRVDKFPRLILFWGRTGAGALVPLRRSVAEASRDPAI